MSRTTAAIIVIAILALFVIVALAARYFGILIAEDQILQAEQEYEEAVEIDDDDDDDDDDYYPDEHLPAHIEYPEIYKDEYLPPPSAEFTAKFREYYAEERASQRLMRMRSFAPHLFDDDWYENTRSDFSQWSVDMREVYAIAS